MENQSPKNREDCQFVIRPNENEQKAQPVTQNTPQHNDARGTFHPLPMKDGIHPETVPTQTCGFTTGGVTVDIDDKRCFAKSVFDPGIGTTKYYILTGQAGVQRRKFLNKQSMSYCQGDELKTERGRKLYDFDKVEKYQFELYVEFLRTNSNRAYDQAMRGNIR